MKSDNLVCKGEALDSCQMCKSKELCLVIDLGLHAPADAFLKKQQLHKAECRFPLRLVQCNQCGLLQLDYLADREAFYGDGYVYVSSTTTTGRKHYADLATEVVNEFAFPKGSLAIDIGSNVGVLLEAFKNLGMTVLGVDPAPVPANEAIKNGIPTIVDFFDANVAEKIATEYGKAHIITGTNVFAHLHKRDDAVSGMKKILTEDGVIIIEAPYALDTIEHLEYDQIYLEHLAYLSVRPMKAYFATHGLELFKLKKTSIHGGTLRYYVGFPGAHPVSSEVDEHERVEYEYGLYNKATMESFAQRVHQQKQSLLELLLSLKKQGKRIVGVSAPAKGNTLLNYCRIDNELLEYVTEKNVLKIDSYTPGMHLPVVSDERLVLDKPEYALLLAWNFADEIIANNQTFQKGGGRFIIPIPEPRIV